MEQEFEGLYGLVEVCLHWSNSEACKRERVCQRPEGWGSHQALASTGSSRWTSSPSVCFLLTLLFFIILFYILPAFGLAIFLDHVLSRWFL